MGLSDFISKVSDPYERQARLWPALLAMLPLSIMLELLYGPKKPILTNTAMIVMSCGGLYLLMNVCRELGKRLELNLFYAWGGKPSTQLLRHRDGTIESVTKCRYHNFLSNRINEVFPDKSQEENDPQAADNVYQSAVRWLLNQTRDTKKFALLFQENISYGFRRNALGVKPIGITICIISISWVLVAHGVIRGITKYIFDASALVILPETAILSLSVSVLMLLLWLFFFTQASVRSAAFSYAEMLLRACDLLENKSNVAPQKLNGKSLMQDSDPS